jgi:DNA-binding CsgD family transcriptional regulator
VRARDSALIDFVEAAYDLGAERDPWFARLMEAGAPVLDQGLGFFALSCVRPPEPGPLVIEGIHVSAGGNDFVERVKGLQAQIDSAMLWPLSRPGVPKTLSEVTDKHNPAAFQVIMSHFDFAKDGLGIPAFDPDGRGIYLLVALPKVTTLSTRAREGWHMLAAHFAAGYRLRRALEQVDLGAAPETELPFGAEIVIDPLDFSVTEATGKARSNRALASLREAAEQVDRARGQMRESDPAQALALWRALVRGRWSTVDWFDSDGRRYVLGIPNAPDVSDPRGLTERETQVVEYAFLGLSNKMIGYNLGISDGRVSTLLGSAMKKLAVNTRPQLIKKLTDFRSIAGR